MVTKTLEKMAERELLSEIVHTVKNGDDQLRDKVICEKIPQLKNKHAARDELIKLLGYGLVLKPPHGKGGQPKYIESDPYSNNFEARSWATTALAVLLGKHDKLARQQVIKSLEREPNPIGRYHMLIAAHKMGNRADIRGVVDNIAQDYRQKIQNGKLEELEEFEDQPNERAAPLAIAIQATWGDAFAVDCLEALLKSGTFGLMWSTCRALEMISVREMLGILSEVAADRRTWPDIRNRCILAIGKIESPSSAHALSNILATERDPILRETVIRGLVQLGTSKNIRGLLDKSPKKDGESPFSIADSLMPALFDENAQIRHRAAEALSKIINESDDNEQDEEKKKKAETKTRIDVSEKIVGELIKERVDFTTGVPKLVDALRVADPPEAESASMVLSRFLFDDDISVRRRAEHALKLLGGEKAVQTLIGQRSEVLRAYNDLLSKADEPIQELFKETMHQARQSFWISQVMSIIVFVVGIGAIITGLWVAFTRGSSSVEFVFGAGTSIVGAIAVLLDLMVRDPHKRVQEATSILLRIKVIFLGYLRQIHQIDATFKHEFIEGGKEFGQKDVEQTTKLINAVMKNTMTTISQNLPIRNAEKLAVDEVLTKWKENIRPAVNLETGEPKDSTAAQPVVEPTGEKIKAPSVEAAKGGT